MMLIDRMRTENTTIMKSAANAGTEVHVCGMGENESNLCEEFRSFMRFWSLKKMLIQVNLDKNVDPGQSGLRRKRWRRRTLTRRWSRWGKEFPQITFTFFT